MCVGRTTIAQQLSLSAPIDPLATNEQAEVKQKLNSFDRGEITLEEATEPGGEAWGRKVVEYYSTHTNDVTTKMKLPISRCCAALSMYLEAANLASDYVQVYSNDWRGWKILGGANSFMGNYEQALAAATNSLRLGDEGSYVPVAMLALHLDRLDLVRGIVPHLLELKNSKPPQKIKPLDAVAALVLYSLKADQRDIFIEALDGISAKDILSRDDLKQLVTGGCDKFEGKEIDKIRQEVK